jgi:hypothetical protein
MKPRVRSYANTQVDKLVQHNKRAAMLKTVNKCELDGVQLEYKLEVEYLGTMWQGDGGCEIDVSRRLRWLGRRITSCGTFGAIRSSRGASSFKLSKQMCYPWLCGVRGVKNVLSDLSELVLGPLGHSLGHVLSESVSQ